VHPVVEAEDVVTNGDHADMGEGVSRIRASAASKWSRPLPHLELESAAPVEAPAQVMGVRLDVVRALVAHDGGTGPT
jgi:hypothetical protein